MKLDLVQMESKLNDKEYNLGKIEDFIDQALGDNVNLIVFPELALTGYMCRLGFREMAEPIPGPSTAAVAARLRGSGLYAILGMPEAKGGFLYNAAAMIGPEGVVGVARKMFIPTWRRENICFEEGMYFRRGPRFQVFDTRYGRLGILICYDVFFPEAARALAFRGATLLVCVAAAGGSGAIFHPSGAARAWENAAYLAMVGAVGRQEGMSFEGGSFVANHRGQEIKCASVGPDAKEEVLQCEIEMEAISRDRLLGTAPFLRDIGPEDYRRIAAFMEDGLAEG